MLERRLDVMCLRTYLYTTLKEAKEYISNGYITVNNKIIKSCNYILKDKDIFSVRPNLRFEYKLRYLDGLRSKIFRRFPPYLHFNIQTFEVFFIKKKFELENIPHLARFPWMRFPNPAKRP
jgi:ribosomal protein S4